MIQVNILNKSSLSILPSKERFMGNFHQTRKVPVRKNRDEATHSGKSSIPNREIYEANKKTKTAKLKNESRKYFFKKRENGMAVFVFVILG